MNTLYRFLAALTILGAQTTFAADVVDTAGDGCSSLSGYRQQVCKARHARNMLIQQRCDGLEKADRLVCLRGYLGETSFKDVRDLDALSGNQPAWTPAQPMRCGDMLTLPWRAACVEKYKQELLEKSVDGDWSPARPLFRRRVFRSTTEDVNDLRSALIEECRGLRLAERRECSIKVRSEHYRYTEGTGM